jgi:HSP20 family protein
MLRTYTQPVRNPWKLLEQLSNESAAPAKAHAYPLDVSDEGDHLRITLNMPGATAESVDVQLERRTLTISATLESASDRKYLWRERPSGQVRRTVQLPVRLNPDATTANLENGVLTVTVAKAAEATARAIRVDSGPATVQVQPIQADPSQAEPVQVQPIQAEPVQAEPVQADAI